LIAELMLFNLETAMAWCKQKPVRQESFYISMLRSYREANDFISNHGSKAAFRPRLIKIAKETDGQEWFNRESFLDIIPVLESDVRP